MPDHHPRYVVRELRGGKILPRGERGMWSTTFTLLDSWYGYQVVLQRESGLRRAAVKLREQFQRAADYMNAPPKLCVWEGCSNEVPRSPLDSGQRRNGIYCSTSCKYKAKYRRDVASGRRGHGRLG